MAKKLGAPKLFDVLPAGLLNQSLAESFPEGTKGVWQHVGSLQVTGDKLAVIDAGSLHPRYLESEAKVLDWPYRQAELAVRFAEQPDGNRSRVLAVLLTAPVAKLPKKLNNLSCEFVECSMAIDSATAAVGDFGRMKSECRAGGKLARVLVGKGDAKTAKQKKYRQQAAMTLKKLRLPVADKTGYDGKSPVSFTVGLSDKQIEQARRALAAAEIPEEIWVPSAHTANQLGEELLTKLLAWYPNESDPCLLAFRTGFGDGMYEWQTILSQDQLCGYLCDFLPESENDEQEESGGDSAAERKEPDGDSTASVTAPPVVLDSPPEFPADLAPALKPGMNVAAKYGGVVKNWFMAQLVAKTDTGYTVRTGWGDNRDVGFHEVVPMPNQPVFKVGDVVVAHCGHCDLKAAAVREVTSAACKVEWHAKEPLLTVPIGELTFAEWLLLASSPKAPSANPPAERKTVEPPQPADAAPALGPGVTVAVRIRNYFCYIGQIMKAVGKGFVVKYLNGGEVKVQTKKLIPVPTRHVFRTGDHVIAVWENAAMYPGRITAMSPLGYTIAWDDGSGPQIVPLGSLTFVQWAGEE